MKQDYYILRDGILTRKENTVYFESGGEKRAIPVEKIYAIYAYGSVSFSSGVVSLLAKHGVPLHLFGYYGWYEGSFYPRETLLSGDLTVKQAQHYLDVEKRLALAKCFVQGATGNILRNLQYYAKSSPELNDDIAAIERAICELEPTRSIPEVMHVEGAVRERYYTALDRILPENYKIGKRTRMPPGNKMNTLISFANGMVYSTVLSEIYNTHMNPTVSFLHEPHERRFSLSLDVAEVFKPILADSVIFKLVNKKMLDDECFKGEIGDMLFSEKGKRKFLEEWNEKLSTTIEHRGLGRNVSYRRLIRLELYKLEKHLLGVSKYRPLILWW